MYTLGIDGGGSKTEAVIIDNSDRVLGTGRSGGCNTNFATRRDAVASYVDAIRQALDASGLEPRDIGQA
ncbi:MAG: BadF/BadG/BcrA/BcrD ATPase family protein, partial [Armatimonadota bacterium]